MKLRRVKSMYDDPQYETDEDDPPTPDEIESRRVAEEEHAEACTEARADRMSNFMARLFEVE